MPVERIDESEGAEEDTKTPNHSEEVLKRARELEDKLHQEEIARARAETERDTVLKMSQTKPESIRQPTDDEWRQAEEATGKTRNQMIAEAQMQKSMIEAGLAPMVSKLQEAEERSKKSEERLRKFETKENESKVVTDFFKDKPHFVHFKDEINDFISMFPESDREDPRKLKTILQKSEVYLRGVAKEKTMGPSTPGRTGSSRFGIDDRVEARDEDDEVDTRGLKLEQARLVSDIHAANKSRLSNKEESEFYKKHEMADGLGVEYNTSDEWKAVDDMMKSKRR